MPTRLTDTVILAWISAILLAYPYGISIVGDSYLRVPDFFAIIAMGALTYHLYSSNQYNIPYLTIALFGPFLVLEFITPILGWLAWGSLSGGLSSLRLFLIYGPILLFGIVYSPSDIQTRTPSIDYFLRVGLTINVVIVALYLLVLWGPLTWNLIPATHLEPFAVDGHFQAALTTRPPGTFTNVTGLAVFGIICLSFYLSLLNEQYRVDWGALAGISFGVVLISLSRTAIIAAIFIVCLWIITQPQHIAIPVIFGGSIISGIGSIVILLQTNYFDRIFAITDPSSDASFVTRFSEYWPEAVELGHSYSPTGTLIHPTRFIGVIDSGYLTLWAQAWWFGILIIFVVFVASTAVAVIFLLNDRKSWPPAFVLFFLAYLVPAMIFSFPLRRPISMIAFTFALIALDSHWKQTYSPEN